MRFIDISDIENDIKRSRGPKWEEKAQKAHAAAASASPAERSVVINNHAKVWQEVKELLAQKSNNKCWYCETEQERSDDNVDHYRPKNSPVDCKEHPGYWWLAFTPSNYRYSCTYCNSRRTDEEHGTAGGKHNHFPLEREKDRAFRPQDVGNERPLLLDPTVRADIGALWFEQDGRPVPRYAADENASLNARAKKSIELYHLDHQGIVSKRKLIFNRIDSLIKLGNECLKKNDRSSCEWVEGELRKLADPNSEHSAAARAYIKGFRSNKWVDALYNTL
ncbi:hypothetical protein HV824_16875 [Myxococcus sp. AM009]|uniref:HNH endonuclease n=1 Tax=Myxococcus sp. AM009 TaxID=2745137 RepID=UPI0015962589|nr:hypothetical protein [Myxococcus sp. AM009]NVI99783.1 hypothetical protein [Myxococcus sp. AM009]